MKAVLFKSEKAEDKHDDPYVKALAETAGVQATVIPTLQFEFVNVATLKKALECRESYFGLALASPRAVLAVANALSSRDASSDKDASSDGDESLLAKWSSAKIFVVGQRTASVARASLGNDVQVIGEETGNAERLAPLVAAASKAEETNGRRVLLPCGDLSEYLFTALKRANVDVESVVSYRSLPAADLTNNVLEMAVSTAAFPRLAIFFSPSGFRFTLQALTSAKVDVTNLLFCAIGATTKRAIEAAGFSCFAEADKPNPESLAKSVSEAILNDKKMQSEAF